MGLEPGTLDYSSPTRYNCDNGSQIVGSVNSIQRFLGDVDVQNSLMERNIKRLEFAPYPDGAKYLGGVVEFLVMQVKILMNVSIGKNC